MKDKKKQLFEKYMIRPMVYQFFTRLVVTLALVLLWNHFVARWGVPVPMYWGFVVAGVFFLVMAWMAYLRRDGIRMPKFDRKLFRRNKKPVISSYADMSDFTDEDLVDFDDLDDGEKDLCLLLVDVVLGVGYLGISFIV